MQMSLNSLKQLLDVVTEKYNDEKQKYDISISKFTTDLRSKCLIICGDNHNLHSKVWTALCSREKSNDPYITELVKQVETNVPIDIYDDVMKDLYLEYASRGS